MDDEPRIADLMQRHLKQLGYQTFVFTDPLKALDAVKNTPEGYDLIISDVAMPKMTGDRLVSEALKTIPGLLAIISTGYSKRISEDQAYESGASGFLMKPVNRSELAMKVRQVLDQKSYHS